MNFSQQEKDWAKAILKKCDEKYTWVAEKHKDGIPYTTDENGCYDDRCDNSKTWGRGDGVSWWTNGFWGGVLWHVFENTGNPRIAEIAKVSEVLLDQSIESYYGLHHDVGFMWLPTAVADYRLTGDLDARRRALHAANILAGRFNPVGKFIRAWNDRQGGGEDTRGWAIIDCMLNIPLLYWATQETGDPRYEQIAIMHADTVMKDFIREDGSSNHIVEFDPFKGGVVKTYGGQGYENGSAWTRGQAWGIYGFAVSYQQTKKPEYLATAKKIADFAIAHMADNGIIPVDFLQPAEPALEDSCGAAIMAGGFFEIANECEGAEADKYRAAGLKIMHALDDMRANYGEDCDAILQNCTGSYHQIESRHITMVYADYYYIENLTKIAKDGEERKNVYFW